MGTCDSRRSPTPLRRCADRQTGTVAQQLCPVIVGREGELDALWHAMAVAIGGEGQCVLLVGEAGIGKSRLAREVTGWATEQGVRVATGRAGPSSASTAYGPVSESLLQLFRRVPLPDDPGLAPWLPLLQPLLPNSVERVASTAEVSPGLRGEAVLQLLGRLAPRPWP